MMEPFYPILWLITGFAVMHHAWPVAIVFGMLSLELMVHKIVGAIDRVRVAIEKGSK